MRNDMRAGAARRKEWSPCSDRIECTCSRILSEPLDERRSAIRQQFGMGRPSRQYSESARTGEQSSRGLHRRDLQGHDFACYLGANRPHFSHADVKKAVQNDWDGQKNSRSQTKSKARSNRDATSAHPKRPCTQKLDSMSAPKDYSKHSRGTKYSREASNTIDRIWMKAYSTRECAIR